MLVCEFIATGFTVAGKTIIRLQSASSESGFREKNLNALLDFFATGKTS